MEFAVAGTPRDEVLASCAVNQVDGLLDLGMAVVIPDLPLAAAGPGGIAPESSEDPGKCRSGERMVVEVEEFDEFAPATYPHEPVVGADDLSRTAVASGPRFVAKLELA